MGFAKGSTDPTVCSPRGLLAVDEAHLDALLHRSAEPLDIPVGQADAAMGVAFADARRIAGAVDAIARLRQSDPHHADRIVGAGPDGERPRRFDALEFVFRIVAVG